MPIIVQAELQVDLHVLNEPSSILYPAMKGRLIVMARYDENVTSTGPHV